MNCVAVPVYKAFSNLSSNELISYNQLIRVLGKHPIVLFGAIDFDFQPYLRHASDGGAKNIAVKRFACKYFENIDGYNRLLKSYHFYSSFRRFNYMLIYQLDAYVFRDELEYWCSKGYDYIGAPWFEGYSKFKSTEFICGGNGGFSLRNNQKSILILKRINAIAKFRRFWFDSKLQSLISYLTVLIFLRFFKIVKAEFINELIFDWNSQNEDYRWSYLIKNTFSDYHVALPEESVEFSFEVSPSYLYKLNGNRLPFGCHAWEKYEPEFWKKLIN